MLTDCINNRVNSMESFNLEGQFCRVSNFFSILGIIFSYSLACIVNNQCVSYALGMFFFFVVEGSN